MRGPFIACPLCSVLKPGVDADSDSLGHIRTPWIRYAHRSKKVFFSRSGGCSHGPVIPESADTDEAFGAWDEWARAEAVLRADYLKFTPRRRALFFYILGIGTMNEVLATPKDPPAVVVKKPDEPLKPMFDREDRTRVQPVGNVLPPLP